MQITKGVFFLRNQNRFVISDDTDSSLPKNGRSEKESFTMTLWDVLMLLAMRKIEGKKQQTYSCGEDKKEKQHKLHMNL